MYMMKLAKTLGYILILLAIVIISCLSFIDRDGPVNITKHDQLMNNLYELSIKSEVDTLDPFEVGWAKANITPDYVTSMAGYGKRSKYIEVHDSLYARTFVFQKGNLKAAMVSIDLLIFPPSIAGQVGAEIKNMGWEEDQLYFSATHTHSGIGGWLEGIIGYFSMGEYNEETVTIIANRIVQSIHEAESDLQEARVGYKAIKAPEFVYNRLHTDGPVDDRLHVIKFIKRDGECAILSSYNAHPTCINSHDLSISNDYPYYLIHNLEVDTTIDFSAFFAGAMGSHGPMGEERKDDKYKKPEMIGKGLARKILDVNGGIPLTGNTSLLSSELSFPFDDMHIRVSDNIRTRKWVFNAVMGELDNEINVLKIGDVLFLSTPCELSGELTLRLNKEIPASQHLIITSFNGTYMGYVTPDEYYDKFNKFEVRGMNWTGPKSGSYFTKILGQVIDKVYVTH